MIRGCRSLALAALLLAVPACKKKGGSSEYERLAGFAELVDAMCACRDPACADSVAAAAEDASRDLARQSASHISEEAAHRLLEMADRLATCSAAARTGSGSAGAAGSGTSPAGGAASPLAADALIASVYRTVAAIPADQHVGVSRIELEYVNQDGVLDAQYGRGTIAVGTLPRPDPADDPDRPIGAPVRTDLTAWSTPDQCTLYSWTGTQLVTRAIGCTGPATLARPRCSMAQIWALAVKQGAPAKALASIRYDVGAPSSWYFTVEDAPRNIHVALSIDDTCEPVVEALPK